MAALPAPTLISPTDGTNLDSFGASLNWSNPALTRQVHLQVIPFNNDGPGVDWYIGAAATTFLIPPPPQWYGLLPDMTYTWRVRVSDAPDFVDRNDPSWSSWAQRVFRTPGVSSATVTAVAPAEGAVVNTLTPTLLWANSRSDVFYYEVQLSKDRDFSAKAFLYHELRHGGATIPPNSYMVPGNFPLEASTTYYWRVRPRVQGDGMPVGWSQSFSFTTAPAFSIPTPTPTSTATRTPVPTPTTTATPTPTPTPTATPPATPTPTPMPMNKIAFESTRDGNREIYLMNPDGSGQTRLTNSPASDDSPAWSPDGKKIAYISDSALVVMNSDGSNQTRLTSPEDAASSPAWSPDGKKIAFAGFRNPDWDIFVINADGAGLTRLSSSPEIESHPSWSPDGRRIAFSSRPTLFAFLDGQIYTINVDGTGLTRLTNDQRGNYTPRYSPDGARIAFSTFADGEVSVMQADGRGPTRLTNTLGSNFSPTWSPDGRKLVFASNRDINLELYVMNADGTGQVRLTNSPGFDQSPDWSFNAVALLPPAATATPTPTGTLRKPDLVVTELSVSPTSVPIGGTLSFGYRVVNQGQEAASLRFSLETIHFLSRDGSASPEDTQIGFEIIFFGTPLRPGDSNPYSASKTLPSEISPGTWFFCVTTDMNDAVFEADETNNTTCKGITVTGPSAEPEALLRPSSSTYLRKSVP